MSYTVYDKLNRRRVAGPFDDELDAYVAREEFIDEWYGRGDYSQDEDMMRRQIIVSKTV